jgi:hypothetical protein
MFGKLRLALFAAVYLLALPTAAWCEAGDTSSAAPSSAQQAMPAWARRGLPGHGHAALQPLAGTWRVENSLYIAVGTRDNPAVSSDLICRREWVGEGRYLRDVIEGTMAGGRYWRLGLLGYSNMDDRYEWVTVDGFNAGMMIYLGAPRAGTESPIVMTGVFTDQGVLGEQAAGKLVAMRTVIRIESNDRHTFELYVTPPGEQERLADRKVYTRMAE